MAIHGNGTFDHDLKKWKLRTKGLKTTATVPQLRKMFGANFPASERESRPYWMKYLTELRKLKTVQGADAEPETAKGRFKDCDPDPRWSKFERGPGGEIRRKKPLTDAQRDILILTEGINDNNNPVEFRDHLLEQLQQTLKPEIPEAESLKAEIDAYVEREKIGAKSCKRWGERANTTTWCASTSNCSTKRLATSAFETLRDSTTKISSRAWTAAARSLCGTKVKSGGARRHKRTSSN